MMSDSKEAKRALMANMDTITDKQRRINRAMGGYRKRRMKNTAATEHARNIGHSIIQAIILSCIASICIIGFTDTPEKTGPGKKQYKLEKFISGYYYPYAKSHGMRDSFYSNIFLTVFATLIIASIRNNRQSKLNAPERVKATERNLARQEHVKHIAYSSDIDGVGLDNIYNELSDTDYRDDVLRLAYGLARQDGEYLAQFLKNKTGIKNKQIAIQIIRGHLARHPHDIIKLKPIISKQYIPADIRELYNQYINAQNRIIQYADALKIKRQMGK